MANIWVFRPNSSNDRIKCGHSHGNVSRVAAFVVWCAAFAVGTASAQNANGSRAFESQRAVHVDVGTVVRPILSLKKVGDPVRLDDGRYEQQYQITANVLFRLQSSPERDADVRCAVEAREVTLAEYTGFAGFRTEIRVRSTDLAALEVSAERLTGAATVQPSGR